MRFFPPAIGLDVSDDRSKEEIKEANEPEFKLDVSQPQAFAKQFKKNGLEGL